MMAVSVHSGSLDAAPMELWAAVAGVVVVGLLIMVAQIIVDRWRQG